MLANKGWLKKHAKYDAELSTFVKKKWAKRYPSFYSCSQNPIPGHILVILTEETEETYSLSIGARDCFGFWINLSYAHLKFENLSEIDFLAERLLNSWYKCNFL